MANLDATKFLEDLTGKHARAYTEAVQDMLIAIAMGNEPKLRAARKRMEEVTTETMGMAEILGATLALRKAGGVVEQDAREAFSAGGDITLHWDHALDLLTFAVAPIQTILPRVTFDEAVQDMIDRTPVTIRPAAERTAQRISELYGEGRVVAFARSAEAAVTDKVQALLGQAIREGIPGAEAGTLIRMGVEEVSKRTAAWSESYARMAFRTNVNTAVTAGRFRQAQDPDIKAVIPAFRFETAGDSDVRGNHAAADGLIFRVDNTVWNRIAPPLGYSCRCRVSFVGTPELRRMGRLTPNGEVRESRLPAGAHPDAGFRHGGRPDLFVNEVIR